MALSLRSGGSVRRSWAYVLEKCIVRRVQAAPTHPRPERALLVPTARVVLLRLRPPTRWPPFPPPSSSMSFRITLPKSPRWRSCTECLLWSHVPARQVSSHVPRSPLADAGPPLFSSNARPRPSPTLKTANSVPSAPHRKPDGRGELSDQEWEIRTGMLEPTTSRSQRV